MVAEEGPAEDVLVEETVAEEEPEFHKHALDGRYGAEAAERAKTKGLALIAYSMQEVRKGWLVKDLITRKSHFWPTQVRCKKCNRLARVVRGVVQDHQAYSGLRLFTCNPQTYVGEKRAA